jgi:hypothetical protein
MAAAHEPCKDAPPPGPSSGQLKWPAFSCKSNWGCVEDPRCTAKHSASQKREGSHTHVFSSISMKQRASPTDFSCKRTGVGFKNPGGPQSTQPDKVGGIAMHTCSPADLSSRRAFYDRLLLQGEK